MSKVWLVAQREYLYNIRRPAFLFAAFGTPLIIIASIFISVALQTSSEDSFEDQIEQGEFWVGYVDQSGLLSTDDLHLEDYLKNPEIFIPYSDRKAARAALDDETLDAYIVIDQDYIQNGLVTVYSYSNPSEQLNFYINRLMNAGLSTQFDESVPVERLINPVDELTIYIEDSKRELSTKTLPVLIFMPFIFAVIFTLSSQVTSGFLMAGLVEEKTNRIMEVLITSITPMELLLGKIIGLGVLGLTQVFAWVGMGIIAFLVVGDASFLEGLTFPVDLIVYATVYFLLGYFFSSAVMAGIGAVVGSEQESRQYAGALSLVLFLPYFFIVSFITDANGTIPIILSIFPLTAPMAMIFRIGLTSVPTWQIVLSMGLMLVTIGGTAWVSARIFRWGLLMYGKRVTPKMLLSAFRGRDEMGTVQSAPEGV